MYHRHVDIVKIVNQPIILTQAGQRQAWFAIDSHEVVNTGDGLAVQVNGTSNKAAFGEICYTDFLIDAGFACKPNPKDLSENFIPCFYWCDKIWTPGMVKSGPYVGLVSRFYEVEPVIGDTKGKGFITKVILYEADVSQIRVV